MSSLILLSQTQLDLGEVWLKLMGEAAQRYGITIQYINSVPSFMIIIMIMYLVCTSFTNSTNVFYACRYCAAWTRHVMQSITIPAVTQVRASGDYQPNNNQWLIREIAQSYLIALV